MLPKNERRASALTRGAAALALAAVAAVAQASVDVDIEGLDGAERDNVEQRLSIVAAHKEHLDRAHATVLHARAPQEIRDALQPFGYYAPIVDAVLEPDGDDWRARYEVDRGPPTLLDQVDFKLQGEGAADAELQRVLSDLPLHSGERLLHARYEEAKAALARTAYVRGYLDARFTRAQLRVRVGEQRADALVTLDTGMRYQFGPVRIEQQGLDPALVARYVAITPGTWFDPQKLLDARFALTDLDYFQTVDVQPQRDQLQGRALPILISTTPRPPQHYEFGVGYGTDTGARLSTAAEFRRLNEEGHKLLLDLKLSEVKNVFTSEYRIPAGTRPGETWSFQAGAGDEKLPDGYSSKYSLGTSLSRVPGAWKRRYYLSYEHEDSRLGDTHQTTDLLIPGVALNRTELDDPVHARHGWYAYLDVHGASRFLIANTDFLQARTQLRAVVPLGAVRLLGRFEYGASLVSRFSALPASQRFFAGGDESVRGYAYQSLGPRDALGNLVGGKYLTTFSLEGDYFPWEHWGGALFYDAGGADDDPWPRLFQGVGVGARYRAPVGFVQVDLAHPLDGDKSGVRLHLGVRVGL
jgi:translocation and assembly module TamA